MGATALPLFVQKLLKFEEEFVPMFTLIFNILLFITSSAIPNRLSPHTKDNKDYCRAGLCAGPKQPWIPSSPNISYYAEFNVPPLPSNFSSDQTYFIYYNIIFKSDDPYATNNQFVPQLMLGEPLCDSTGYPNYNPIWKTLNQWHIGAQYFFFIQNDSASDGRSGKAVTGKLIDVYEGDLIYTEFALSEDGETWTLTMGIKGNESAVSVVEATAPFMGLDPNTKSWKEDRYNVTRTGCCWELYGMEKKENYPNYMDYQIRNKANVDLSDYWSEWQMVETPNCSYSPTWTLDSGMSEDGTEEIVMFDIFYE